MTPPDWLILSLQMIRQGACLSDLCHRLDLLVSVAPDLLCFLRGSWGIHLCLSLGEFVFGICRFLQSCKTYHTVLCGANRLCNAFTIHSSKITRAPGAADDPHPHKQTHHPEVGVIIERVSRRKREEKVSRTYYKNTNLCLVFVRLCALT